MNVSCRGEENLPLTDCLQIVFSRSNRHHLFVVYPREIVIMDVEIRQAVGSVVSERNTSAFVQVQSVEGSCRHCLWVWGAQGIN